MCCYGEEYYNGVTWAIKGQVKGYEHTLTHEMKYLPSYSLSVEYYFYQTEYLLLPWQNTNF